MTKGGRVLIVEDHPLMREGLALAVRSVMAGVIVVGVGSVAAAVAELDSTPSFRMVLLDFQLPDAHGYSGLLALQFRAPAIPIVMVTAREDPVLVEAAKALGAAGFLSKRLPLDDVAARLRDIDEGRFHFPPAAAAAGPTIAAARTRIGMLSPAQHGVLMALADGRSNKEIARERVLSEATVKAHLTAIFRKMGVANRTQALLAIQPLIGSAGP